MDGPIKFKMNVPFAFSQVLKMHVWLFSPLVLTAYYNESTRHSSCWNFCSDLSGKARPFDWIQTPLALTYAPDGSAATVAFPCISTPVHAEGQLDEESSRFYGARYMKCPSAAWCMEWCMTGAFREPQSAQADAEE